MAAFDIAVGISADALNSASVSVHEIAPQLFAGTANVTLPVINTPVTVGWNVKQAPYFKLPAAPATAEINVLIPLIEIDVTATHLPTTSLSLGVDVDCDLNVDNAGHVLLTPKAVAIDSADLGTPLVTILNDLILPNVLQVLGGYIPKVQLPPLQAQGVSFSPPKALTSANHLIAVAVLASKGPTPEPPVGTTWPAGDLFALLSDDTLDAAAIVGLNALNQELTNQGGDSVLGFGYEWHYRATLSNPHVTVAGQSINFSLAVTGSAGAGITGFGQTADVTFDVSAEPNPSGALGLAIDNNNGLVATVQSVNPFAVVVVPQSAPGWIDAVLSSVEKAIEDPLAAAISSEIHNVSFRVFQIPNLPVSVAGVTATIKPHNLGIGGFAGMLSITGAVDVA